MKIHSDFAILDVKEGREALYDRFPGSAIPVTITGVIDDAAGHDDGVSREFSIAVSKVHLRHQSGTKVFYDHHPATVLGDVEGWYQIRFSDGSTNIVRPSHLKVIP